MTATRTLRKLYERGHAIFENGYYNLNIVGIRNPTRQANRFDDKLVVAYREHLTGGDIWVERSWSVTTDPGLTYLLAPQRSTGCAVMLAGQYRGAYVLGQHHGRYAALVQDRPIKYVRDNDRDAILDIDELVSYGFVEEGLIGANIHAADNNPFDGNDVVRPEVGPWSAACQVFQSSQEYRAFWDIVAKASRIWGPRFTYTLIED